MSQDLHAYSLVQEKENDDGDQEEGRLFGVVFRFPDTPMA